MLISELLKKKREGYNLTAEEIRYFIRGLINNYVSDIQAAAFLTSACIHGLNRDETAAMTFAMRDSGMKFDFSDIKLPKIDKHSTGGVGDKISLLLVPICMSAGIAVPMISGRGLGHTGGTVDKLESIDGFNMQLDYDECRKLLLQNNAFMTSQTPQIAPADGILYHIRDVTGNVESVGLITASIMSKKLVEDLDGLVIDMKTGNGAFMQDIDEAKQLAESMLAVASDIGLKMRIIFSSMEQPLGYAIGNWLEIEETIESLKGNIPPDIEELTLKLADSMVLASGINDNVDDIHTKNKEILKSGQAYKNFLKMVESQGGNLEISRNNFLNTPTFEIKSDVDGYVSQVDTINVGIVGIMLGAGRQNVYDKIDYAAGIELRKKIGDKVSKDETIAVLYASDSTKFADAAELLKFCIVIKENDEILIPKLIIDDWYN
ncbi:MAG: thymidine phosphorylase [Candidatus Kapabacteria bacterium]|nr:thymidine phosphorylase [Candidatus Kapabacteria bacterium]